MKRALAFAAAAVDRVNPIVVKEFRQAVQDRLVVAVLLLFLLISMTVIGAVVLFSPDPDATPRLGQSVFASLLTVLALTSIGFIPLYAGVRLSMERSDANVDLLFVTTITPGAIIRGKFFSAAALTLLVFSACLPFITMTYLLRGIDLPTIFLLLAYVFYLCMTANMLGIFAGAIPGSLFLRGVVGLGLLVALGMMFYMASALTWTLMMFGAMVFPAGRTEFWIAIASCLLMGLLAIGLLYVFAVALLTPRPANRMLVPRIYVTVVWAIGGIVAMLWSYFEASLNPMCMWVGYSGSLFIALTVTSLGEREAWAMRVRKTIPRRLIFRLPAFLLYTGSAGGIAWCALMLGATVLLATAWPEVSGISTATIGLTEVCTQMPMIFGYALCYCLTVACARRWFFKNASTLVLPWAALVFGSVGCTVIPLMIDALTSRGPWTGNSWWLLFNPFILTSDTLMRDAAVPLLLGWVVVSLVIAAPWAWGQWRRFVPYQPEDGASPFAQDAPPAATDARAEPVAHTAPESPFAQEPTRSADTPAADSQ